MNSKATLHPDRCTADALLASGGMRHNYCVAPLGDRHQVWLEPRHVPINEFSELSDAMEAIERYQGAHRLALACCYRP